APPPRYQKYSCSTRLVQCHTRPISFPSCPRLTHKLQLTLSLPGLFLVVKLQWNNEPSQVTKLLFDYFFPSPQTPAYRKGLSRSSSSAMRWRNGRSANLISPAMCWPIVLSNIFWSSGVMLHLAMQAYGLFPVA